MKGDITIKKVEASHPGWTATSKLNQWRVSIDVIVEASNITDAINEVSHRLTTKEGP